jgi:hypothetical protein
MYPAVSGKLEMTGERGHSLGRGQTYSYPARVLEFGASDTTAAGVEELMVSTTKGPFLVRATVGD